MHLRIETCTAYKRKTEYLYMTTQLPQLKTQSLHHLLNYGPFPYNVPKKKWLFIVHNNFINPYTRPHLVR